MNKSKRLFIIASIMMCAILRFKQPILLWGLLLCANVGQASVNVTSHVTIQETASLNASPRYHNFGTVNAADLNRGHVEALQGTGITIKSNTNWQLRMRPLQAHMGQSGSYTKPLSDFQWRISGQDYAPISSNQERIYTGQASANTRFYIDYKVNTSWEEPPGNYGLSITFMLSSSV